MNDVCAERFSARAKPRGKSFHPPCGEVLLLMRARCKCRTVANAGLAHGAEERKEQMVRGLKQACGESLQEEACAIRAPVR